MTNKKVLGEENGVQGKRRKMGPRERGSGQGKGGGKWYPERGGKKIRRKLSFTKLV